MQQLAWVRLAAISISFQFSNFLMLLRKAALVKRSVNCNILKVKRKGQSYCILKTPEGIHSVLREVQCSLRTSQK